MKQKLLNVWETFKIVLWLTDWIAIGLLLTVLLCVKHYTGHWCISLAVVAGLMYVRPKRSILDKLL